MRRDSNLMIMTVNGMSQQYDVTGDETDSKSEYVLYYAVYPNLHASDSAICVKSSDLH